MPNKFDRRVAVLFSIFLLMAGGLMVRLLLIATRYDYVSAAGEQRTYKLEVCTTRGTIYDCMLRPLAGERREYRACVAPSDSARQRLRMTMNDEGYFSIEKALAKSTPFVMTVENGSMDGGGVTVLPAKKRYSTATLAPHIVGYLDSEGRGVSGVERAYNEYLEENSGEMTAIYTVTARGGTVGDDEPVVIDTTDQSAAGVVLTIDADVQRIAETAAKKYLTRGAIVVMELPTGKIRASVSLPDFSPDDIAAALEGEHSPLVNRAISAYDIGSVFKLTVAAAALENGVLPERKYCCEGCVEIGTNVFNCSNRSGHGEIDMREALAKSCNTYFIDLAADIGYEKILAMAKKLGFGDSIELMNDLYAEAGCLPSESVLQRPAGLANFAFGQGELLSTPVQAARLIAVIANGGFDVEPTLYEGLVDTDKQYIERNESTRGERLLSERTAEILREAMCEAVLSGTAKKGASPYVTSAAKTGTAQTGIKEDGRSILEAWYAGFFPAERPQYVCVVLAENGDSGGATAGPVFKEIIESAAGH